VALLVSSAYAAERYPMQSSDANSVDLPATELSNCFRYQIMHASFEFEFDLLQLRLQSLADGMPEHEETPSLGFPANVRETKKVEDFWLSLTTLLPVFGSLAPELQQTCLLRVQLQIELMHSFGEFLPELLRIRFFPGIQPRCHRHSSPRSHHDGLNSVERLIDTGGSTRLSVAYDAWGNATSSGPAVAERFRYRGAFQDGDTGLLLFGRRWYDPALGRWLTQDPILADVLAARRDAGSAALDIANLYLYVANNPLNLVDPSGLSIFDFMKRFQSKLPGKVLVEAIRWSEVDPKTHEPKGTMPQRVEKQNPVDPNEDEVADTSDEFEPGAGEGSHSPSSERTYSNPARFARGGGGGAEWVLAFGAAALVVVLAAPVEVPAAIGGGIVATCKFVFD
jgi:RHS repeat-associated protein